MLRMSTRMNCFVADGGGLAGPLTLNQRSKVRVLVRPPSLSSTYANFDVSF
jgi:hypothetical protein